MGFPAYQVAWAKFLSACTIAIVLQMWNNSRMFKEELQMRTMEGKPVNYSIRLNRRLKTESEAVYRALGMNLSAAIQVFLTQSVNAGGFPFDVRLPLHRRENLEAWREAKGIAAD